MRWRIPRTRGRASPDEIGGGSHGTEEAHGELRSDGGQVAVYRLKVGRGHAHPGDEGGADATGGTSRWSPKICKFHAENLQVRGLAGAVKWFEG